MFKIIAEIIAEIKAERQSHEDIKNSGEECPVVEDCEKCFWILEVYVGMFYDVKNKIQRIELHMMALQGLSFFRRWKR